MKHLSPKPGLLITLIIGFMILKLDAQNFSQWDTHKLMLNNGVISREISFGEQEIHTIFIGLAGVEENFIKTGGKEFSFSVNEVFYSGNSNKWMVRNIEAISDETGGNGILLSVSPQKGGDFTMGIEYLLFPELPVIRKRIHITNLGEKEFFVENVNIEILKLNWSFIDSWTLNNYCRQTYFAQLFEGNWNDPLNIVHDVTKHRGVALGNEAPGVMKYTSVFYKESGEATIGLTPSEHQFPFRKWVRSGETWTSPWVFTGLYSNTDDPIQVVNGPINDYVREHMGIRLAQIAKKPVFVYNTWEPFHSEINEKMIMEVIDAAAECGFEEFVIDDGWQDNYGDWNINKDKFPNGLKPIFDNIKSKGMKPGLWISIASAQASSNVFREHPEWLVRKVDGSPINLHYDDDQIYGEEAYSMCLGTGWSAYIKEKILELVHKHGLEYVKADFAIVTGAYSLNKSRSGCHATDHPYHKDHEESYLALYRKAWELFDELHEEAPDLFIDCTFETMGSFHLIDYDMCKHAEGNWLSNFLDPPPTGSLRVRDLAWRRSPVIPATTLVIGNQHIDHQKSLLSFMSLAGSLPIMLGDPRNLNRQEREEFMQWAEWLKSCQQKHDFMMFRQDLSGFGQPMEGVWDGFQRINTETKSGGIVGVFKQNARENSRKVFVQGLDATKTYEILESPNDKIIAQMRGNDLVTKGFNVVLERNYDGNLYQIQLLE